MDQFILEDYEKRMNGAVDNLINNFSGIRSGRASTTLVDSIVVDAYGQNMKIKDLNSQRAILRGIFVGWTTVFIILLIIKTSSIYFIILTGLLSLIVLMNLFSLIDQIKEEKNTLTEKEIYLLQQLAKKK